jgi:hypothetical protein
MFEQTANRVRPVLEFPLVKRTRRNHGLEHATVHILSKRIKNVPMMGRSSDRGFVLFADVPQPDVESAVREALRRMKNGEHSLAVHPGCGTSRLTSGFLTSMVAIVGLTGATWRTAFNRLPFLMVMMMLTALFAEPLGLSLQRYFTTEGDPGDMEIVSITKKTARMPLTAKPTTMYLIETHST